MNRPWRCWFNWIRYNWLRGLLPVLLIEGHAYIEQPNGELVCENCGKRGPNVRDD